MKNINLELRSELKSRDTVLGVLGKEVDASVERIYETITQNKIQSICICLW